MTPLSKFDPVPQKNTRTVAFMSNMDIVPSFQRPYALSG